MTLKELRYVVAVAGELHFGRAAEKCFVSQPALSLAVQKLEEELDVKIFERRRNDVMVTPVGALIVQQARRALEEIDAIKEFAHGGRDPLSGVFRLGVINSVGPYLLPELVPALHRIAPRMPLEIEEGLTANLETMLKRGALDAIVIALPFESAGVETRELFDEAVPPARSERPSAREAKGRRQRRSGRREAADVARRALLPRSGARCVSRCRARRRRVAAVAGFVARDHPQHGRVGARHLGLSSVCGHVALHESAVSRDSVRTPVAVTADRSGVAQRIRPDNGDRCGDGGRRERQGRRCEENTAQRWRSRAASAILVLHAATGAQRWTIRPR